MVKTCERIAMDEMLSNESLDPISFLEQKKMQLYTQVEIQELINSEASTGMMYHGIFFRQIDITDFRNLVDTIHGARTICCNVFGFHFIALDWKPDLKCYLETQKKYPGVEVQPMRWLFILSCDGREGERVW